MRRVQDRIGDVVARVVRPLVDEQVRRAIREHEEARPHLSAGDLLEEPQVYGDSDALHVHPTAVVNDALFNLSSGHITVSEYAFFGHGVSVLTGTHDVTTFDAERQVAVPKSGRDVVIGRGVWVSSNATVLGPCRIGEHAVVAAGALVTGDVEAYAIVAGVPAKQVKTVPRPDGS
jgi:acetyltransferase-like isoleucine patch superfamily enzyme